MIATARDAPRVLFDASPIIRFLEGGEIVRLSQYVGAKAAITLDVANELLRLSHGQFPGLIALSRLGWPPGEPLPLPPDLLADADALRRLNSPTGAHEESNRGEVSTALLAGRLGDAIVVMDDRLGKQLCLTRGVPRISTAQLAAEMVAVNVLDEESGFTVFDVATPEGIGRPEFDDAVDRAREALGT